MEQNNDLKGKHLQVRAEDMAELLTQLHDLTELAALSDKVTTAIGKFIPGMFDKGTGPTFNMMQIPAIIQSLQKDSAITTDCAALGEKLTAFKAKYDLTQLAGKYNKVING